MERLTQRLKTGEVLMASGYEEKYTMEEWISILQNCLAAYEDTGLTPEEVAQMQATHLSGMDMFRVYSALDMLGKYQEAEKNGRVVVLPCKVGDTVYWLHGLVITKCLVHRIQQNRNGLYICIKSTVSHGAFDADLCLGKTIFLTYEEAEAALEAMERG